MATRDEPLFETPIVNGAQASEQPLRDRVRRLLETQRYAVLCTQGDEQPYGSLIAFATTADLCHLVFVTPKTTRKYRLLTACAQVALVCDDRSAGSQDLMEIEAVTATGRAHEVDRAPELDRWRRLLTDKHPYLTETVAARSSALFRVDVVRYFHVVRFQHVGQWVPTGTSSSP